MQTSNFDDVGRFHAKFGLPETTFHDCYPRHPEPEMMLFRMKFMLEEFLEFLLGIGAVLKFNPLTQAIEIEYPYKEAVAKHDQMFDALIDLVYVAYGTAHILGYPWQRGWEQVQAANMSKERATEETASERGGTFDVIKPPGWVAPDIAGLLNECGWVVQS